MPEVTGELLPQLDTRRPTRCDLRLGVSAMAALGRSGCPSRTREAGREAILAGCDAYAGR